MTESRKDTPAIVLAVAWVMVLLPLSWGVYQSVVKSLPLFQSKASSPSSR